MHVIQGLGRGGAEQLVLSLAKELEKMNVSQLLCVLGRPEEATPRDLACQVVYLGCEPRIRNPVSILNCARKIRESTDAFDPQIIHTHLWPASFVGALAVGRGTARHLCHIHDTRAWLTSGRFTSRVQRSMYRIAFARASTRFVACAEAVRVHAVGALGLPQSKVAVVHNGVAVGGGSSCAAEGRIAVIGVVGRLTDEKGQEHLLRAMKILRDKGVICEVRLAGVGSRRAWLEALADSLGIRDHVQFLGGVENMSDFYAGIDILAIPSLTEGFPMAMLEAMAAGKAVVASDVAGIPEAIRDGKDGILVPPGDPQSLADGLSTIVQDKERMSKMARSGFARVKEEFSIEKTAEGVLKAYLEIADRQPEEGVIVSSPKVTVVIPTRDRLEHVRRAVQSSLAQEYDALEVRVYDDASSDGTTHAIRTEFPHVTVCRCDERVERLVLRNRGIAEASGEYVFTLDDDFYFTETNTIGVLVEMLEQNTQAAAAVPPFVEPTRSLPESYTRTAPAPGTQLCSYNGGACMFRKSAFMDAGCYRELLIANEEERDLAMTLVNMGRDILFGGGGPLVHLHGAERNSREVFQHSISNTILVLYLHAPSIMLAPHMLWSCMGLFRYKLSRQNAINKLRAMASGFGLCLKCASMRQPMSMKAYRLYRRLPSHAPLPTDGDISEPAGGADARCASGQRRSGIERN